MCMSGLLVNLSFEGVSFIHSDSIELDFVRLRWRTILARPHFAFEKTFALLMQREMGGTEMNKTSDKSRWLLLGLAAAR